MLWSYLRSLLPSRHTQAWPRVQGGTMNPPGTTARGPKAHPEPCSLPVATSTQASGSAGAGQSVRPPRMLHHEEMPAPAPIPSLPTRFASMPAGGTAVGPSIAEA